MMRVTGVKEQRERTEWREKAEKCNEEERECHQMRL